MYIAFLNLGYTEILLILLVSVLLFGGRLPKVARDIGRWFFDFKGGLNKLNREIYAPPPRDPPEHPGYFADPETPRSTSPYTVDMDYSLDEQSGETAYMPPEEEEDRTDSEPSKEPPAKKQDQKDSEQR